MANTWILIRHPDKEGDKEGVYLGDTAGITDYGRQQMPTVIDRLKLLHPDVITCSLFPRAVAFAEVIAKELGTQEPMKHGLFNEIAKPRFLIGKKRKGRLHTRVTKAIRNHFDNDTLPTDLLRGEKIEARSDIERRVSAAYDFIERVQIGEVVLTVSHAKFIAAAVHMAYLNDGTLKGFYDMADRALKFSTTGITILSREPNRRSGKVEWHIKTLNEEAHIDTASHEALAAIIKDLK